MTPLINNITPIPTYQSIPLKLGGTVAHSAGRPILSKIGGKKILIVGFGPSTPGQVLAAFEQLCIPMVDVQFVNCCVGGQDVVDCMDPDGPIWANVDSKLKFIGRTRADVQMVITCNEDLHDQSLLFSAAYTLKDKMVDLIEMMGTVPFFPSLQHVELFSRFNEDRCTDPKFKFPTGYHNGFSNKFIVEECISRGGRINDMFVNDLNGYLYTDGEKKRSDGFQFFFSWLKRNGAGIHLDTAKQGDEISAGYLFNNMKLAYPEFK